MPAKLVAGLADRLYGKRFRVVTVVVAIRELPAIHALDSVVSPAKLREITAPDGALDFRMGAQPEGLLVSRDIAKTAIPSEPVPTLGNSPAALPALAHRLLT